MSESGWPGSLPEATGALEGILDAREGPLEPPIRAEIFGQQRFAQHGRSLGETHRAARASTAAKAFFPRLRSNIRTLRAAHRYIGLQAEAGYDVSPAAEWLLDNFHLIEGQLKAIHDGLPRRYFRALPVLLDEPLAGLPRVYGVAWAYVAHSDGAFDPDLLAGFLAAYQETRSLDLSEMWALPTTLRVVLVENLRRLAERLAAHKAVREMANVCCDRLGEASVEGLEAVLVRLRPRGLESVFLAQLAQRMADRRASAARGPPSVIAQWLAERLPDPVAVQAQQIADQTADNLSVSNAVNSLRAIGDADWQGIVARSSPLMQAMLASPVFQAEHAVTRDRTLHAIERLAHRSGLSELTVARLLLAHMQADPDAGSERAVAGFWLHGAGRAELERSLGTGGRAYRWHPHWLPALRLPLYAGTVAAGTIALTLLMLALAGTHLRDVGEAGWLALVGVALMLVPASEAVLAVVNRLISESTRPVPLSRLALDGGLPDTLRTLVVIPAMLVDAACIAQLAHRIRLHYLSNPERNAQFALLTDWVDADQPRLPGDAALLSEAVAAVSALNRLHPSGNDRARFLLLHRPRRYSPCERRWIGWERKRGKLEQLLHRLATGRAGGEADPFLDLGDLSMTADATRYVLTLDSDTRLPPGRLRELVGVAAHPGNTPRLSADGRRVDAGHAIFQPRVVTPLSSPREFTLYHWLFAGQDGIDPYSAATSEVYQDLFDEGTFTGKGLMDVQAVAAVLGGHIPEGQVLSHDLLEGAIARCAAVTDITLIEDAPFHADVAASRVHRWTRGDWQLLPILFGQGRLPVGAVGRWKMLDNLRRSLVAPTSLLLVVLALSGATVPPWVALVLVGAAFTAGPAMGALAANLPSRDDLALRHFYAHALIDLARAACGGLWHMAQLLQQAMLYLDAIVLALHRTFVSRRHLLQWTTAADAQASAQAGFGAVLRRHAAEPATAALVMCLLLAAGSPWPVLTVAVCLAWGASPAWTWWASRRRTEAPARALAAGDAAYLEGVARDTWRLFERCVGPADNHLPPDNLQVAPYDMVAHRTSPTNVGLYLLSIACAHRFGWIGTQELLARIDATLGTLGGLQRHRGHFLNWYDTRTCEPLIPMYVSTVDSGNLSGHLLAVAQACRELAAQGARPAGSAPMAAALSASLQRISALRRLWPELLAALEPGSALVRLLDVGACPMEDRAVLASVQRSLPQARLELERLICSDSPDPGRAPAVAVVPKHCSELLWALEDYLGLLQACVREAEAMIEPDGSDAIGRLRAIAERCEAMAWAPEFGFLYHGRRHLFHIGFRVAEQELDAGFYDLLASESRLTSLLAIAKGDVPVAHWSSLGRPFYALGTRAGLRSWSGSMFEYLMPTLMLEEPDGSVLNEAARVAVEEQIAYTAGQGVPWGLSESAHAGRDHTLAYQYSPQGVPRLALRRTPADELVVAPYASALAAQVAPRRARCNLASLQDLGGRGRYGFIEALDFTPARQASGDVFTAVGTFMAHHQGMTIVALANVLLGAPVQRWGMADPRIEAVSSLLHERAPREVSMRHAPPSAPAPRVLRRQAPRVLRELRPGAAAVEPTHLLSNGRYHVSLRANGAGWSRRGNVGITRWRDDLLRDACGSFLYVRRTGQDRSVSITSHPAPDAGVSYESVFHADRVCFDARWPAMRAHVTVWVSPEDDIEFRQVEVNNLGDALLDIELMSSFEVTLSEPAADEAHPAFTNLFVRAGWDATDQALMFERTPRLPTEAALQVAHFLAEGDPGVVGVRVQTDRQRWLGRNHDAGRPLAAFEDPPVGLVPAEDVQALDTGLDPVACLAVRLRIAPGGRARLTFATAAADDAGTLRAIVDKYRQPTHVARASLMSATLGGIRLHVVRLSPANLASIQTLTTALVATVSRPAASGESEERSVGCDRRLLWRFGISGDLPLILVSAGSMHGISLVRALAEALRLWSWGGVACDLVVLNSEALSYHMPLQQAIAALRDRHSAEGALQGAVTRTSFHLLRTEECSAGELASLHALARFHLVADGRPLAQRVREWTDAHGQALASRKAAGQVVVPLRPGRAGMPGTVAGRFIDAGGEFEFDVGEGMGPERPWINVLSNPGFGAQISEAGGGYTWAVNSRLNQLTAWSNDAVGDPPSEWFLIQDPRTGRAWTVAPSARGDAGTTYRITHGQGYTVIRHRMGDLEVMASWCVDPVLAVKQVSIRLVNHGSVPLRMRVVAIAEWMMGASRSDRATVHTSHHSVELPDAGDVPDAAVVDARSRAPVPRRLEVLLATQAEHGAGFGEGTAFLALAGAPGGDASPVGWTCDRRECFDPQGRLALPARPGGRSGAGLDPCALLATEVVLHAGSPCERVFLIGHADAPEAARALARQCALPAPAARIEGVRAQWDRLLGAIEVRTPDPLFDALVNRWLLYQAITCRLWSKSGFYQAGGASGFRDQLQDAMALAWTAPAMLRAQIITCAGRQFPEGDVQHWWHAPGGAGVRTRFSDDLLWLPLACAHYVQATGDAGLLDEPAAFLEGAAIPDGAEDSYYTPAVSSLVASVYEHAALALDRSLRTGAHGLPLMGTGDWNDGMNRVGHEGRGESVWLGWFLCRVVSAFAPLAIARGEDGRAERWTRASQGWRKALDGPAWDGHWYRRAFFDDGSALGASANAEARIDLIAQAWAVLSGAAPLHRQRLAMDAVDARLTDRQAGLLQLLAPPLQHAQPVAGYIQAYPPGVRENGGQYSHAGVWALMARAALLRAGERDGDPDLPWTYFTWLSPAHRSAHPMHGPLYRIEPYVMAGDTCSQPPYVGRGGWSWYTGAAAWMHRAAIESIVGLQIDAHGLSFAPCLPSHWQRAALTLRREGQVLRFTLIRVEANDLAAVAEREQGSLLAPGERLEWPGLPSGSHVVVPLVSPAPPLH
jgi:cyclic beta-1,2-glucan synthetase